MHDTPSILFAYFMSDRDIYRRRLLNTVEQQSIIDTIHPPFRARRILVTDADPATLSYDVLKFFDGNISRVDNPDVVDPKTGLLECSSNVLRNGCLRAGLASGLDWMMFCDVDTVLLVGSGFSLPATGYARPKLYKQRNGQEKVVDSYNRIMRRSDDAIFTRGNSWFICSRAIMERVRANETMYGYGWEDKEFDARVQSLGYRFLNPEIFVIHIDHPHEERRQKQHLMERNEALWNATHAFLQAGYPQDTIPEMVVVDINNEPGWRLCVSRDWTVAIDPRDRRLGKVARPAADTLTITWSTAATDTFKIEGFSQLYVDRPLDLVRSA